MDLAVGPSLCRERENSEEGTGERLLTFGVIVPQNTLLGLFCSCVFVLFSFILVIQLDKK